MAVLETKVVQMKNTTETMNQTNSIYAAFGWNVLNVQITHSQDTSIYQDAIDYMAGAVTVKTTTIDYATVTYQRDTGIENYREIVALENEYYQLKEQGDELFSELYGKMGRSLIKTYLMIMFWPAGIIYLLFLKKNKDAEKQRKQQKLKKISDRLDEIEMKASALL